MVFQAHVLKVLIASPGDTGAERDAVEASLGGWNASRAEAEQTVLLPWRWEKHAVPVLGATAQGVINAQVVDQADIVIALFDSRLGKETDAALSGTVEEIERAHGAGKPVHVYFSDESLPRNVDIEQLQKLNGFREQLERIGLLGSYASPQDLAFHVRQAIEHDLQQLQLGKAVGPKRLAGARLRAHYFYEKVPNGFNNKSRQQFKTTSRLFLRNEGDVTAETVMLNVEVPPSVEDGAGFRWGGPAPDKPFDLLPGAERQWPFLPFNIHEVVVRTSWHEGEEPHSEEQTITV